MVWLKEPYLLVEETVSADTEWLPSKSERVFTASAGTGLVIAEAHVNGGTGSQTFLSARARGIETHMVTVSEDGSSANPSGAQSFVPLTGGSFDYKVVMGSGASDVTVRIYALAYE